MYNPQTLENIWIFSTFKRNHETTLSLAQVGFYIDGSYHTK